MCVCVCLRVVHVCVYMCVYVVFVYVCTCVCGGGSPDSSQVSVRIWRFSDTGYQLSTYVIVHVYMYM